MGDALGHDRLPEDVREKKKKGEVKGERKREQGSRNPPRHAHFATEGGLEFSMASRILIPGSPGLTSETIPKYLPNQAFP